MNTSDLVRGASGSTNVTQGTINMIITHYTQWVTAELTRCYNLGVAQTFTLFNIVHVGTPYVSYGFSSTQPEPYNIHTFCSNTPYGYSYEEVSAVISAFRREIIKSLLHEGKATLLGIGRIHLTPQGKVVFSLSSTLSEKAPLTSRINSSFRAEFNQAYSALSTSSKEL